MEDLPFAKREPRFKPQQSSWIMRNGAFDPAITESTPQNHQMIQTREIILGNYRHPGIKNPGARVIDSRHDQFARNRQNIFFDSTFPDNPPTRLPRTAPGATRHGMTPYSYNTTWINHPDENTSLYPDKSEMYTTSFLTTDIATADKLNRTKKLEGRLDEKRQRTRHFEEYVAQCEQENLKRRTDTQARIRKNREDHLAALELRHQREKIRFFE